MRPLVPPIIAAHALVMPFMEHNAGIDISCGQISIQCSLWG